MVAKHFSVASWNVEHFKGDGQDAGRVDRVVDFLAELDPDIFALYEVEGAKVFTALMTKMPGYTFQITEGDQTQEILVGVRRTITAFITQKIEFKSGTTHMRPGQLVTVTKDGKNTSILFLHVASGSDPRGMGLRDDMIQRAFKFRSNLDRASGGQGKARYLVVGDLNSMGLKYPFNKSISFDVELKKWDKEAAKQKVQMRRLTKTHPNSWSNGAGSSYPDSALDHVYASQNLTFKNFKRLDPPDNQNCEVRVRGWVDAADSPGKSKWIGDYSDHCLLYFELHEA